MTNFCIIKFEEDIKIDPDPFIGRSQMLTQEFVNNGIPVTYITSNIRYTTGKSRVGHFRFFPSKIKESGVTYILLPQIFVNRNNSPFRRLANIYFFSAMVFFSFLVFYRIPSVIVVSNPAPITGALISVARCFRRFRLVIDVRDLWPHIFSYETKPSIYRKILTALMNLENFVSFKNADAVTSITPDFLNLTIKLNNLENHKFKTASFYICSNNENEQEVIEKVYDPDDVKRLLIFGTMSKTTVDGIYQLQNLLQDSIYSFEIDVCGSGRHFDRLKNLDESFYMHGRVSYSKLTEMSKNADYIINMVSDRFDYNASLSNKFFDALSMHKPIICRAGTVMGDMVDQYEIGMAINFELGIDYYLKSIDTLTYNNMIKSIKIVNKSIFNRQKNYSKFVRFLKNL